MKLCKLSLITLFMCAWLSPSIAQNLHIAYAYPAGGQTDSTLEVTLGGRGIRGIQEVYISGKGISAKILEYAQNHKKDLGDYMQVVAFEKKLENNPKLKDSKQAMKMAEKETEIKSNIKAFHDLENLNPTELREVITKFRKKENVQKTREIDDLMLLKIKISKDADPGKHEIRLASKFGISNPINFYVNSIPEVREEEPNDKAAVCNTYGASPFIINGQIKAGDIDYFKFNAEKGQKLVIEVHARKLIPYLADAVPGWFQAILSMYDNTGKEIAYADDFSFNPDPIIFFKVPKTGTYQLKIHDSIYRGREDFVYRISIAESPFVTAIFPLGVKKNTNTEVSVFGGNLPSNTITLDTKVKENSIYKTSINNGELRSNSITYAVDELPEIMERENNNDMPNANAIKVPQIINGRISKPGDLDTFRFQGRSGDKIIAEIFARRLNSPLDSLLRIIDESGDVLATNDDFKDTHNTGLQTHDADSRIALTLPKDGNYFVQVSDSQNHGNRKSGYRLRVSKPKPDFSLHITPSSIILPKGRSTPVTIHIDRKDGFNGKIKLKLLDAPEGFKLSGNIIDGETDKMTVTISASNKVKNEFHKLKIAGTSKIKSKHITHQAIPADVMQQAFLWEHLVESQDFHAMVIGGAKWIPIISRKKNTPIKISADKNVTLHLQKTKAKEKKKLEFTFKAKSYPEGISIDHDDKKKTDLKLRLLADNKLPTGTKGNLIIEVFTKIITKDKKDQTKKGKARLIPLGSLPAIPFEVIK